MQRLVESVNCFVELESTLSGDRAADYLAVSVATDTMNIHILNAERAGYTYAEIKAAIEPAYAVYGRSPFFHRMQTWPRGYPGDFETIVFLFKHCLESLLNTRGLLFCTNVTPDYPEKTWQRYFTNWTLIERTEADLQQLAQTAGFGMDNIKITRDTTSVSLLCALTKP